MISEIRKYLFDKAWLLPFAYGMLLCVASLLWLISGLPFDQVTYERIAGVPWKEAVNSLEPRMLRMMTAIVREMGGNTGLVAGLFTMVISATGFRKREKWAWFALWLLPAHSALDMATVASYGALTRHALIWDLSLIAATSAALICSAKVTFRKMSYKYHHIGIPAERWREGMVYLEDHKIHVTDHGSNPYGIQWMLYEKECVLPELVRNVPHVAFSVDDLNEAIKGKNVIVQPNSPSPGVFVALVEEAGAPVEFLQIEKNL